MDDNVDAFFFNRLLEELRGGRVVRFRNIDLRQPWRAGDGAGGRAADDWPAELSSRKLDPMQVSGFGDVAFYFRGRGIAPVHVNWHGVLSYRTFSLPLRAAPVRPLSSGHW